MKLPCFTIAGTLLALMLCIPAISAGQLPALDSSAFQYKYEGDVMPDTLDPGIFEVGVAFSDYTQALVTEGDVDYLDVDCDLDLGGWTHYTAVGAYKALDSIWDSDFNDGYTLEFNIRINAPGKGVRGAFDVMAGTGAADQRMTLNIGNGVKWNDPSGSNTFYNLYTDGGTGEINNRDNEFHLYRIAASPRQAGGYDYQVWRDGEMLSYADGTSTLHAYSTDFSDLLFGDPTSSEVSGHYDLDYFRFEQGAYAPALSGDLDGDLNSDGFVGGDDLDIVRSFWGQSVPSGELLSGDPSNDGFVGGDDLDIVRANWGQGTPPTAGVVPEPAMLVMLLGAAGYVLLKRPTFHQ